MRRLLAALAIGASTLAGCSSGEPTLADYCRTMESEGARLDELSERDPIMVLFEMEVMFRRIAANSPADIKDTADIASEQWTAATSGVEPSAAGAAKVIQATVKTAIHIDSLNAYYYENCD